MNIFLGRVNATGFFLTDQKKKFKKKGKRSARFFPLAWLGTPGTRLIALFASPHPTLGYRSINVPYCKESCFCINLLWLSVCVFFF